MIWVKFIFSSYAIDKKYILFTFTEESFILLEENHSHA